MFESDGTPKQKLNSGDTWRLALADKAQELIQRGDLEPAIHLLAALEADFPKDPRWPLKIGQLRLQLEQREPAVEALSRAADLYQLQGSNEDATRACRLILRIHPTHDSTLRRLVDLLRSGEYPVQGGEVAPTTAVAPTATGRSAAPDVPPAPMQTHARALSRTSAKTVEVPPVTSAMLAPSASPRITLELDLTRDAEPRVQGQIVVKPGTRGRHRRRPAHTPRAPRLPIAPPPLPGQGPAPLSSMPGTMERLRAHPLLAPVGSAELEQISRQLSVQQYPARTKIFGPGEHGDDLYLLVDGDVQVTHGETELDRLGSGSFFGEIGLLTRQPRLARVTTLRRSEVVRMPRAMVARLSAGHRQLLENIVHAFRNRVVAYLIQTHELLAAFRDTDPQDLALRFSFNRVERGAALLEQGAPAESLYILLKGSTRMERDGELVRPMHGTDVFGICHLRNARSPISALAETDCWLLELDCRSFEEWVRAAPPELGLSSGTQQALIEMAA